MDRWIPRRKRWLDGYVSNREKKSKSAQTSAYAVTYVPVRCPRCRSRNVKCYSSKPPVRYYGCRACSTKFKAIEENA